MPREVVDLANDTTITTKLLYNANAWRSRVVEELTIDSALACRSRRSLQATPIRSHLPATGDVITATSASLVIPVSVLPKRPLISFSLAADGRPAYLLKRSEIADRQTHFIDAIATEDAIEFTDQTAAMVRAICDFTPGFWLSRRRGRYRWEILESGALKRYVEDGLGFGLSKQDFSQLSQRTGNAGSQLALLLDEAPDNTSSSENPLLALPLLVESGFVDSPADLLDSVASFNGFVNECIRRSYKPLLPLAEYGRRYEALIHCEVPLDRPVLIVMEQVLPMKVSATGSAFVDVVYNDAESNHISMKLQEPDVRLKRKSPRDGRGLKVRDDASVIGRETREELALYGSQAGREYLLQLRFRLSASREATFAILGLLAITVLGGYLALRIRPISSDELAVMVIPTTLTTGFVLAQSRTSIAAKLQRPLRVLTTLTILGLWAVVAVLYITGIIKLPSMGG